MTLRLAAAQGTASDTVPPAVPREIVLQQQVLPYELESVNWRLDKTNASFLKEPKLNQPEVFRRVLQIGKDTNNAIALIWDRPQGKLYLDLNRNLDLTDDAAGVFSSPHKEHFSQLFTNVTLPLKTATGFHPARLDFTLTSDKNASWIQVQLASRSWWQAKVASADQEWQVAAVDDIFGPEGPTAAKFLLLRPWAVRTNRLYLRDLTAGIVRFPDRLFWLGQAFQLERRFETQDGIPVCKLELTPQQPPLTELNLSGESLYYAVLRATNGYTAVLGEPPSKLLLPQGIYTLSAAWLKKGAASALRLENEPLIINATSPTNVVLGGPLTNSVTLERQGRKLSMNYQLVGADGGSYRLAQQDRSTPPEFTVYHAGKKVQSGKFEFG